MNTFKSIIILALITSNFAVGQDQQQQEPLKNKTTMKTYVIERIIPGAGDLTAEQLKSVSQTSCIVIEAMGPKIEWQHSYVTGDKVYCVYNAATKDLIEEHAKKAGIPANSISEVKTVIGPETAKD